MPPQPYIFASSLATFMVSQLLGQTMPGTAVWKETNGYNFECLIADGSQLRWIDAAGSVDTTTTTPFTQAGGIQQIDPDIFLVSGRDEATGDGYILRVGLVAAPSAHISILETKNIGAVAPSSIAYTAGNAGIVVLDRGSHEYHFVSWSPGGTMANPVQIGAYTPTGDASPWFVLPGRAGVSGELQSEAYAHSDPDHAPQTLFRYDIQNTGGGVWTITTHDVGAGLALHSTGWHVRDIQVQGTTGTLDVAAVGGGTVLVIRESDGLPTVGGTVSAAPGYHSIPLSPGILEVEHRYRLEGSGYEPSQWFRPSFREGIITSEDGMQFTPQPLNAERMKVGALDFRVWGHLSWEGPGPLTSTPIHYYLWATIGEPGPGVTTTLPDGRVVLTDPLTTYEGSLPSPIAPLPDYRSVSQEVPIPADAGLAGLPLLFQWIAVAPNNEIFVSDVFGGKILPGGSAAAASGGGGISASSSALQGTGLQSAAQKGRSWLLSSTCPLARQVGATLHSHLIAGHNASGQ